MRSSCRKAFTVSELYVRKRGQLKVSGYWPKKQYMVGILPTNQRWSIDVQQKLEPIFFVLHDMRLNSSEWRDCGKFGKP
jgi:hypothetical protein